MILLVVLNAQFGKRLSSNYLPNFDKFQNKNYYNYKKKIYYKFKLHPMFFSFSLK